LRARVSTKAASFKHCSAHRSIRYQSIVHASSTSELEDMANKDHWSAKKYKAAAEYVPQLATKVIQYLGPQPGDHILDIGCGDGQLTSTIAQSVGPTGRVLGLDASPSFIETAQSDNTVSHCSYALQDCTALATNATATSTTWDKAFSNAALHWILNNEATRSSLYADVFALLKPGGKFVLEMGGKGDVAELHAAFIAALTTHGELSLATARAASPWFFPSTDWMTQALIAAGFEVEVCESEYRPTNVTDEKIDGNGGIEGWVRLMGARFLMDWVCTLASCREEGVRVVYTVLRMDFQTILRVSSRFSVAHWLFPVFAAAH
jgi:trans-aconitate methyltransferase